MRKVEITEEKLLHGRELYLKGDVTHFEDDVAAQYIEFGWVKDAETGETGERVPGARGTLHVQDANLLPK